MASSPPQNNAIKFFFYGQEVRRTEERKDSRGQWGTLVCCSRRRALAQTQGHFFLPPAPPNPCILQASSGAFHLVEATLELDSRTFTAMVKSTEVESAPIFATVLRQALADAHLIDMDLL